MPGLEGFYDQQVSWSGCGGSYQCAVVEVPMDYENPAGETIEIALKMLPSTGETSLGSLFINPGGPGGSGVEMVENASYYFSGDLLASYDIVGFDPRGVGESNGVRCLDSQELEEYYSLTFDLETDQGWDDYVAALQGYGEECLANTGPVMEFLDTVSVARDLDILRAALDEPTLTYLGFSYGTFLGAHYAQMFPQNVGRLVLDGAVDPSLSYAELTAGQNDGFEVAYRSYLEDCLAGARCPFSGSVDDAWERTVGLLEDLYAEPADSGDPDRPATDGDLISAILIAMYGTDWWPTLTEALTMLLEDGDASLIKLLSDTMSQREPDGSYPADQGAFRLINCLDYPVEFDRAAITAEAEALTAANEVFGPYLGYGEVGCATLPFQSTAERTAITAPGTPPIVVIGTTRDPATPYEWAVAMAEQLESGVLLSYDGDGHTAYGYGSCIDAAVDGFLIDGVVPDDGLSC